MELSFEDVHRILQIINESSFEELHIEIGDFKLVLGKGDARPSTSILPVETRAPAEAPPAPRQPQVSQAPQAPRPPRSQQAVVVRPGLFEVKAPLVGVFYRRPSPDEPPFVEVGSMVEKDDPVCIIEVMKLFNRIKAGCKGKVVEILVEDGEMVQSGRPLMLIEPPEALAEQ